jgi:hypothetical protein
VPRRSHHSSTLESFVAQCVALVCAAARAL